MYVYYRKLSVAACYSVSDDGLLAISVCNHLRKLNISYCHLVSSVLTIMIHLYISLFALKVTDIGLMAVAQEGILRELVAKGCLELTDKGNSRRYLHI